MELGEELKYQTKITQTKQKVKLLFPKNFKKKKLNKKKIDMPAFFTSHAIKSICSRKNKQNKNKKAQNHTLTFFTIIRQQTKHVYS